MARLGELLVAAGLLTVEQVEQALRAQVLWGGRLGTNLVELGFLDLDALATRLAQQRGLPAAFARHFDKADPELQQRLSPALAERHSCVPLLRVGEQREQVAITSIEPLGPRARARIADELMIDPAAIVNAIAPELRIRYHLERVYRIPRDARFLRARGKTIPPFPQFPLDAIDIDVDVDVDVAVERAIDAAMEHDTDASAEPSLDTPLDTPVDTLTDPTIADATVLEPKSSVAPAQLEPGEIDVTLDDDDGFGDEPPTFGNEPSTFGGEISTFGNEVPTLDAVVPRSLTFDPPRAYDVSSGRERRRYIRTIADGPDANSASLARLQIRRVVKKADDTGAPMTSLESGIRAIRRGTDRDKVAELALETVQRFVPRCAAAVVLVLRGDTAIGWKSFSRNGAAVGEIVVPLDQPGLLPRAASRVETIRDPIDDLTSIDRLIVEALHARGGELVVVPVTISHQVMCLIATVMATGTDAAPVQAIATAAGTAFARLMRHASR